VTNGPGTTGIAGAHAARRRFDPAGAVCPRPRLALTWTGLRHLVVVDGDGRVAGILTHERVAAAWLEPHSHRPMRVQDAVEAGGVFLVPSTSAREAARLMLDHGVHALPVVRDDGVLVGVLSWTDLVALLATG